MIKQFIYLHSASVFKLNTVQCKVRRTEIHIFILVQCTVLLAELIYVKQFVAEIFILYIIS